MPSGASAGNVEAGVNGLCESQWYALNYRGPDFNIGLGCEISSGAVLTYAVQHTFANLQRQGSGPDGAGGFVEAEATVYTHDTLAGKTVNDDGNYTNPPTGTRLAITAHTSGTASLTIVQAGRS